MTAFKFRCDGFALISGMLLPDECQATASRIEPGPTGSGGTRRMLEQPWCAQLAERLRLEPDIAECLAPNSVPVLCTYFEKSAHRNWTVPLHQDLSMPVAARCADPALGGWSDKEGMLFVRAPDTVLAQLVAVRVHLDTCSANDGALRVVPGSHRFGALDRTRAHALRDAGEEVVCSADAGAVLIMHPLLLHASSKSTGNSRRRVLHFLFGPAALPHGVQWPASAWQPTSA